MRLIILMAALLLSGCTTTKAIVIGCKINVPSEPYYPVQGLKKGDSAAKVMKSYVATVQLQHDYIGQLKHVVKGCE